MTHKYTTMDRISNLKRSGRSMVAKQVSKTDEKNKRLQKALKKLKKKEHWMKWGLIAAIIIILLLLLFLGYATDWARGLHKASTTPLATGLDSQSTAADESSNANTGSGGGSNGGGGGGGSTSQTGTSNTTKESTNNSTSTNTTTNTSSTTTNNNTDNGGGGGGSTSSDELITLYNSSSVGEPIQNIIARGNDLGLAPTCTTGVLIETCTYSEGDQVVTIKSIAATGLVTSITQN